MIAALPMYARAALAPANDRYWGAIRDQLRAAGMAAPDALSRGADDLWPLWTAPDLVLAQTCGLPYRTRLHGKVTLVGTPDFALAGCKPGYYCSVLVARADDPRNLAGLMAGRFAYNDALSQSGWAAAHNHVAGLGLALRPTLRSGGHRRSAVAVVERRADLAAIDAVTWRLMQRHDGGLTATLREVARTAPTPGLPYITALGHDPAVLFAAIAAALAGMADDDRQALGLRGLVSIPAAAYLAQPVPPPPEHPT